MRQKRNAQTSIYELFADHALGRELQTLSEWLDAHRAVLTAVMNDLCRHGLKPTGRRGLSAESVLRCALLKQHPQLSYEELAFYLQDSASFQAFARLPVHWCPKKSALQRLIAAIQPQTWAVKRAPLYRELIAVTRATLATICECVLRRAVYGAELIGWASQVKHYETLILQVISQTERRVFGAEIVPASDKIVSLFEPHTDIIVKGRREVQYGHKLNLVSGRSGLILDVVIEHGNPPDSARLMPMLERHQANYGVMPRQLAADGGYASAANLRDAKAAGVADVAFHKKRGLAIEDMTKSPSVYRRLRNFRAGIEAGISCLKRAYGLARCTWKGLPHFEAYVWSSVVAYNLSLLARYRLE